MSLEVRLKRIAERRYVGPSESFDHVFVGILIYYLGERAPRSRSEIAKFLGLGEGSVRTILKRLKRKSLINVTKEGVFLSDKGKELFSELKRTFPVITKGSRGLLSLDGFTVIVLAKSMDGKVSHGIEQRDMAIRYGAKGAMTLTYQNGHFEIPGESGDCEAMFPSEDWSRIRASVHPENGDVIVVCGADTIQSAYLGCFSAALTLLQ
ncbi:MAG: DUF4443 domain-containing protein [Nitrososphaeria archaeon]